MVRSEVKITRSTYPGPRLASNLTSRARLTMGAAIGRLAGWHTSRMRETTEDWSRKWWARLHVPLGLIFLIGIVVKSFDQFTSGDLRLVLGAVAWTGFWAWLFLRPLPGPLSDPPTADELRSRSRPTMVASAAWTAAFVLLTVWSVLARGYLRPGALVAVAIPLVLLLGSWYGYNKADTIARKAAEARGRSMREPSDET